MRVEELLNITETHALKGNITKQKIANQMANKEQTSKMYIRSYQQLFHIHLHLL
jgi:hypothetical protein